jgi:hypothetical protein
MRQTVGYAEGKISPVPGSLNKKGGKRWNLGYIFCHSAFFGFVSQRWNHCLRREKSWKKLQSGKEDFSPLFLPLSLQ